MSYLKQKLNSLWSAIISTPGLGYLAKALMKVIELENSNRAGRVNLGIAIIIAFVMIAYFVADILSATVSRFGPNPQPPIPWYAFIAALIVLCFYGFICIKVITTDK